MSRALKDSQNIATLAQLYRARQTLAHQAAIRQANQTGTSERNLQLAQSELSDRRAEIVRLEVRSSQELSESEASAARITALQSMLTQRKHAFRECVARVYESRKRLQIETKALQKARAKLHSAQAKFDQTIELHRLGKIRMQIQKDLQGEWQDELMRTARRRINN